MTSITLKDLQLPTTERVAETVMELCRRNSVSGNESAIASWTAERMRSIGLDVEVQEVLPQRPNVIGTIETGRPGPTLLFNGHLDTLPIPEGYSHEPMRPFVHDGRLYGAEVNNMKGAVGSMIETMAAISAARDQFCGRVILSAVMGECDTLGLGSLAMLEAGLKADLCINGEPTHLQVMTCHVGVCQFVVRAQGRSIHVSRHTEGHNAINDLLAVIGGLDKTVLTHVPHPDYPTLPTVNIGRINGGIMPSMLAADAEAQIDVRMVPGMTPETVLADICKLVAQVRSARPDLLQVEVELFERPQFCQQHPYQVSADEPVVEAVAHAHATLAGVDPYIGALYPQVFFGTDASHILRSGIPTVIYGPGEVGDINMPDESMDLAELTTAAQVYTLAAQRLCGYEH